MDWLNIHVRELDSAEMVGAEPIDRGTWLMLMRYCVGQENGGVIRGCGQWGDRKWLAVARVMVREVRRTSELWHWQGDDLCVKFYPVEKEREVQAKREAGRKGSERRWHGGQGANSTAMAMPCQQPDAERNGIGMEGEDTHPPARTKESETDWLDRLRKQHDGIDVDAELAKARQWKARKGNRGIDRKWFEFVWLKNTGEPVSEARASSTAPDGWREWLVSTYPQCTFVADGKCIAQSFGLLPASVQAEAMAALKKAS